MQSNAFQQSEDLERESQSNARSPKRWLLVALAALIVFSAVGIGCLDKGSPFVGQNPSAPAAPPAPPTTPGAADAPPPAPGVAPVPGAVPVVASRGSTDTSHAHLDQ